MFETPSFFWFFFAIPIIIAFFVFDILQLKKRSQKIAGKNISIIIPYYSEGQKWIRLVFYTLAFCLIILALARPKWGIEVIDSKVKGRDILILLDTSYSMAANDVIPSRYDSAKRSITELLEAETGDRIGLMIFSGKSELISPVTHDYAAISFFLDSIYPGMQGKGGTNIGGAIINAIDVFEDEGVSHKMILLITDGENLQGDFKGMLKKVKESGIKVFTVGVGTRNGEPIPIRNSKGEIESYVKDAKGNHVISRLDENRLKEIANETKGKYLGTTSRKGALKNAIEYIKSVEKKEQKALNYEQKKERYDIFLIPALILFCLGFILDQGKLIKVSKKKFEWLFNKNFFILFFLLFMIIIPIKVVYAKSDNTMDITSAKPEKKWAGRPNGGFWGNISYKKGKYKKALEQYVSALNILKDNELAKLNYNIANVYSKLNDLKKAGQHYENAAAFANNDKLKSMIFYNQALAAFKNQNYAEAAELFKNAIKYNENDDDARYNFTVSNALKKEAEKNGKQKNQQNKNKNEEKKEQKQSKGNQNQQDGQQLSKEDIQKLLKALDEKEKKENSERSQQKQKQNNRRGRYW
ncbi:MAG: VWA domain-containing protein [Spirochaetes bacterium]|nr:VWA domain-containing protein [Spirochaetota bacterium]